MYRCEVCQKVSKPKEPRRVHTFYRDVPERTETYRDLSPSGRPTTYARTVSARKEIAREISVCLWCSAALAAGTPIEKLRYMTSPKAHVEVNAETEVPEVAPVLLGNQGKKSKPVQVKRA